MSVYLIDRFCVAWLHYQKWITRMLNEWMNEWMNERMNEWMLFYVLNSTKHKIYLNHKKHEVKQSHYRPGEALRAPEGWGFHISRHSAHEGGKVVSPTHRPPLLSRKNSWYSFCSTLSRRQGHSAAGRIMSMKKSNDTIGNRTRDLRLVAQCLNQQRDHLPPVGCVIYILNWISLTCRSWFLAVCYIISLRQKQ